VIDNGSTDGTETMLETHFSNKQNFLLIRLDQNMGAACGKNEGMRKAKGDFIIILDDDALLESENATSRIVERFNCDNDVGLLNLKSVNYYTRQVAREEFPHVDKSLDADKEFETSYFVGVGHAVRKEMVEKVGMYCKSFFPYAFEELDWSFRIIDGGYKILYVPDVVVLHKKSPSGRLSEYAKWTKMLENRIRTSIRNLPWRYVIASSFIWLGFVMIKTKGNIFVVTKAVRNIVRDMKTLIKQRHVISPKTITKIKKLRGRLLY
jgi:GT2 family glycosyltransferase